MLPVLELAANNKETKNSELIAGIANRLQLSPEDQLLTISSGAPLLNSRVQWATTYLVKGGLLIRPRRAHVSLTHRGMEALSANLARLDNQYLRQFPEFLEFVGPSNDLMLIETTSSETPEEDISRAYLALRKLLMSDVLEATLKVNPTYFERIVIDVLLAMGYGGSRADAGQAVGRSGDGGIDGIIKEDKLGLDAIYIQAKRWNNTVGRPDVQAFVGSLEGHRANKGVFITTSTFSNEARDYVRQIGKKIVLIDGVTLSELMIDHGVGVSDVVSYTVKEIDRDYFAEE